MTQHPKVEGKGRYAECIKLNYILYSTAIFFFSRKRTVIRKHQVVELKSFHENVLILNT